MTEEVIKPVEQPVAKEPVAPPATTMDIDIDGVSLPNVPIDIAKKIIEKRQANKKELAELREQKSRSDATAKAESEKAALLQAMKEENIEAVKAQVSKEYLDKISKYENKIFRSEIKSQLAAQGVLPSALDDAVNLAMQSAKVDLDGDTIKLNDKPLNEVVEEFVKSRPHLVAVKANDPKQTKVAPKAPVTAGEFNKFAKGLFNK